MAQIWGVQSGDGNLDEASPGWHTSQHAHPRPKTPCWANTAASVGPTQGLGLHPQSGIVATPLLNDFFQLMQQTNAWESLHIFGIINWVFLSPWIPCDESGLHHTSPAVQATVISLKMPSYSSVTSIDYNTVCWANWLCEFIPWEVQMEIPNVYPFLSILKKCCLSTSIFPKPGRVG